MTDGEQTVLVTGGSGFLGGWCLVELLQRGYRARTTVRDLAREGEVRAAVGTQVDVGDRLDVVAADLTKDDGWADAVAGCEYVLHVASPFPPAQPKNPDELIVPARDGTLRVLRASLAAGVKRIVLTSSVAAVRRPGPGSVANGRELTEDDWNDPDNPHTTPYTRSKTIAERAAWDFMRAEGGDTELVVVNPTFILGPPLTAATGSSMYLIKAMFSGEMSVAPRHRFGIADVRDVADLHIRAMAAPAAAGKRFIGVSDHPPMSYLELAELLRRRFGPLAARVPTEEAPGDDLPRLVIHNDRAKDELGWHPRPAETTIADTVENLRERGELPE